MVVNRSSWIALLLVLWFDVMIPEGFVAGTLVHTQKGYTCVQDLSAGDEITVYDFTSGHMVPELIVQRSSHEVERTIQFGIGGDVIEMAETQLVYMPLRRAWVPACQIKIGDLVLMASLQPITVDAVTVIQKATRVYTISLAHHHNYLVGKRGIIVHNYAATLTFAVAESGFLAAFLAANPMITSVMIGVGGAGLVGYFIWELFSSNHHQNNSTKHHKSQKSGGSNNPNGGNDNNGAPGVTGSAFAFLKSLKDSKEKAAEAFRRSYEWLTTTSGGLQAIEHSFRENCRHNFAPLLQRMGTCISDKEGVVRVGTKILADLTQKLIDMGSALPINADNVFKYVELDYAGEIITVQGIVQDGIIKISTMFIQSHHVR